MLKNQIDARLGEIGYVFQNGKRKVDGFLENFELQKTVNDLRAQLSNVSLSYEAQI